MPDNHVDSEVAAPPPKGTYTYSVLCSFTVQYSFPETEVEADPEGKPGRDFTPTQAAIDALQSRLKDALAAQFLIDKVEAYAESDDLIGMLPA